MKKSHAAMLFVGLLWAIGVQAATDCAKTTLSPGENARKYIESYGNDCTSSEVEAKWTQWQSPDPKQGDEYWRSILLAWGDVAAGFGRLTDATPTGKMQDVYKKFSERARATEQSLRSGRQMLNDVTLFRTDAWKQATKMNLPAYKRPGEPEFSELDVGQAVQDDCQVPASELCAATLKQGKQLMLHWKLASGLADSVSQMTIDQLSRQIGAKDALWNRYLYDSKAMLPFDFAATDWAERGRSKSDQYPEGFREPPVRQWFLLHPSFAVEYASSANDGEQFKPVLYLEVIGVNYWNEKKPMIDLPLLRYWSGASLIVSYADRAGIKDSGVGVLLTFDNVYSVGVTRYGSETGISLSFDLANMYREKFKPRYETWKRLVAD